MNDKKSIANIPLFSYSKHFENHKIVDGFVYFYIDMIEVKLLENLIQNIYYMNDTCNEIEGRKFKYKKDL